MAQLGARFHGMEEVIGSIPIRSTKFISLKVPRSAVPCCLRISDLSLSEADFHQHQGEIENQAALREAVVAGSF